MCLGLLVLGLMPLEKQRCHFCLYLPALPGNPADGGKKLFSNKAVNDLGLAISRRDQISKSNTTKPGLDGALGRPHMRPSRSIPGYFFGAGQAYSESSSVWKRWAQIKVRSSLTHTPRARFSKNAWNSLTRDFALAVINILHNLECSCSHVPSGLLEHILEHTSV